MCGCEEERGGWEGEKGDREVDVEEEGVRERGSVTDRGGDGWTDGDFERAI